MKADPLKLRIAALYGFLAVALGALGAHGVSTMVDAKHLEIWKTASHYHLAHALLLVVLAFAYPAQRDARWTFWSFVLGITLFSGSLYGLTFYHAAWLGPVTPLGGLFMLIGWVLLATNPRVAQAT